MKLSHFVFAFVNASMIASTDTKWSDFTGDMVSEIASHLDIQNKMSFGKTSHLANNETLADVAKFQSIKVDLLKCGVERLLRMTRNGYSVFSGSFSTITTYVEAHSFELPDLIHC